MSTQAQENMATSIKWQGSKESCQITINRYSVNHWIKAIQSTKRKQQSLIHSTNTQMQNYKRTSRHKQEQHNNRQTQHKRIGARHPSMYNKMINKDISTITRNTTINKYTEAHGFKVVLYLSNFHFCPYKCWTPWPHNNTRMMGYEKIWEQKTSPDGNAVTKGFLIFSAWRKLKGYSRL